MHHPTQSERYEYDQRGLRTARIVTLHTPTGERTHITRYRFDDQGTLQSTSLPDGSDLVFERNGQGQVTSVKRERIATSWLRWLSPTQTIVKDLQRDLIGLKHAITGNGIEARAERSREGALGRLFYRKVQSQSNSVLSMNTETPINAVLGIRTAHAAPAIPATPSNLPGALGVPRDPLAVLDHRYLWDRQGNLLHTESPHISQTAQASQSQQQSFAYDGRDRLIAVASIRGDQPSASRYFYDRSSRRVLSQENIPDQQDLHTNTQQSTYASGTHRLLSQGDKTAHYNANGQPVSMGEREYAWDALGRLVAVRQAERQLASYTYNHRGERILKQTATETHAYLYEDQQLAGELNAEGQLTRQYINLGEQSLALIDTPKGQALATPHPSTLSTITHDLHTLIEIWFGKEEQLVWLHNNHLGAPEAATNAEGQLIWKAAYAPFGQADITSQHFTLNLRLPGQYEDNETGLYYNRQRYYAPSLGQYLSPDPAGNPDGPNGYSYVRNNPLKYIDPDGLILFAFDGTGNTNDQPWLAENGSSLSNVVLFKNLYASDNGHGNYVSGVGTVHQDKQYGDIYAPIGDMGFNFSGVARINRMMQYFNDDADAYEDKSVMDVDIIGFSRGASEARDFANQIVAHSKKDTEGNYWYSYKNNADKAHCQQVKFRFMGLWDTVLSTNAGRAYNLAIPDQFTYVAQAVALNEYRGDTFHPYGSIGAFPLESIMQGQSSPVPTPGATRIEMGFIGAHADIGGGFAEGENQLPQVALAWMVKQARDAGVTMYDPSSSIISNPVIHDKSDSIKTGAPEQNAEDRKIHYRDGLTSTQREMTFTSGMNYADTQQNNLINYLAKDDPARKNFVTGRVDMKTYLEWLRSHGYDLGDLQVQE